MNINSLKATKRDVLGRRVKSLRQQGMLPANLYGKDIESKVIEVSFKDFESVYKKAGETELVELVIDKKKVPVLIHNVQSHPVSDLPIHADFLKVNLKEKVIASVPIELTGEAPAEKQGLGTVVQYIDEVEVEALPQDLPKLFKIDLSKLTEVDQSVSIKDLEVDTKKVEIKESPDQILVKVEPQKEEEEPEELPTEVSEGEEGKEVEEVSAEAEEQVQGASEGKKKEE